MRKLSLVFVALALTAPVARGQMLDRAKRPVAEPAAPFRFPPVASERLANGLDIRVVEDHSVPVVAVRVVLGVDSTFDPPGKEGLYAVTMGALRDASAMRGEGGLAREASAIGTSVTPTGFTTTSGSFAAALAIMGRMLTASAIDPTAVERRKAIQASVARRVAQTPSTVPRHLFYRLLYGSGDPYTRSLVPTEASVQSIDAIDAERFREQFITPERTTLVIAGDVTLNAVRAEARRVFGKWEPKRGNSVADAPRASVARDTTVIHLVDAPARQAYVYIGAAGPPRLPGEAASAELLGGVATTRMQQELRDKRGLVYSGTIGLTWRRPTQPSAFVGSAVVDPRKVDSVIATWLGLLRVLQDSQPPTAVEVEAARRARVGSLAARFDGPDSVATRLVEVVRDGLTPEYFSDWTTQLASMPASEVAVAARRVIDINHLIVVVSGDRGVIEPALRASKLGPVVIVGADGRPMP